MYPYFRLFRMAVGSAFRKRKTVDWRGDFYTTYRPLIGDLDVYPEVNNGRHFVLFDLARYDLAFTIGLVKYVRKNRLAFVVGGSSIRYRKRLAPFRKVRIRTQLVGMDDKFFYFQHTTEQAGAVCSSALVRTALRMKGGTALPMEVMTALGFEANTFMEPWVQEWATWDDQRPWPELHAKQ
ncbi:thioesterase family protein [Candidatus Poseidoniaceae archaeon]|nr:thioesterase family protein [Euryarchaeota archaeon]MDA9166606.1 thioesterase family protein [Candidatus Poseidoniaceae archaeon]MDC3236356.1 thioesterase family protein [Candidatus Poseidoniaceae archaeon]